jgi:multisubunit Na+/H+ antiporter MnhC subunit
MSLLSFEAVLYTGAIGLLAIGAAGLVISNHLFRMLLALVIAEAGANLLIVLAGFRGEAVAPILGISGVAAPMVDPVPQVLVLTAIVIGVGVQALAVGVLLKAYRAYGTLDLRELRRRMELDIASAAGVEPPVSQHAPARRGSSPAPEAPVGERKG